MKENNDIRNVVAGMADLGAIYQRIIRKVRELYEGNPRLRFEARKLMGGAGYLPDGADIKTLVDDCLLAGAYAEVSYEDKAFLQTYADKFFDPILTWEVVTEFARHDDKGREEMKLRLTGQLDIFPDPALGCGDLYRAGYPGYDLFPLGRAAAEEILLTKEVTVYGIYEDGTKEVLSDPRILAAHRGMFGVKKEQWTGYYLEALRDGRKVSLSFRETMKSYRIYQWKEDDTDRHDCRFMPYGVITGMGVSIHVSSYDLVYEGSIRESATLDDIFEMFNVNRPADFTGHSLSVSDVVAFREEDAWKCYFVDSFGFKEIPDFLVEGRQITAETVMEPAVKKPDKTPQRKFPEDRQLTGSTSKRIR